MTPESPTDLPFSTSAMLEDLRALVMCESPSADLEATARCADLAASLGEQRMGSAPERITTEGRANVLWRWGPEPRVLVVGHLDTVWPLGTTQRWEFTVDGERASGPGAFDMKAGVVQAMHAIGSLPEADGVALLLTTDEEIGSPDSRGLIMDLARAARVVLVPEPSAGAALKVARKGVSLYRLEVHGRAAHAGLEPELGVNAAVELAHQVLAVAELGDPGLGTTVTPTVLSAGTTTNTVPAAAIVSVDVRARSVAEQQRVDDAVRALAPVLPGARIEVHGGPNRPPLEREQSLPLLADAVAAYADLGFGELDAVEVGGGSDGNFTAGVGTPTLDGLGAVGDGAHAEGEWVSIPDLARRAALLAALVRQHQHAG